MKTIKLTDKQFQTLGAVFQSAFSDQESYIQAWECDKKVQRSAKAQMKLYRKLRLKIFGDGKTKTERVLESTESKDVRQILNENKERNDDTV